MSEIILSLQDIVRTYQQGGRSLTVLNKLNLTIRKGEVVALVGPSGCGKTTLLQIAGLLDAPTQGKVFIWNKDLAGAPDSKCTQARGRHIGFVYQFHHLMPEFSALENVMLPQMIAGISRSDAAKEASLLLESLGLADRMEHRPAALSGGEQQRVAIARAVANKPALLLADEPTGNLDPGTADKVFDMLIQIVRSQKLAVLIATHNLELAKRMDRVVHLENGVLR